MDRISINSINESQHKESIKIGIAQGRGFEEVLNFVNLKHTNQFKEFYKGLIPYYRDIENNVTLARIRSRDLPWLLNQQFIDIAIGSSVWFMEYSVFKPLLFTKLPIQKCRLSLISSNGIDKHEISKVCSKFKSLSEQYIKSNKMNAEFIAMEGSHEVALLLKFADAIIDIVETGQTIKKMNLVELESICELSHEIWYGRSNKSISNEFMKYIFPQYSIV